MEAFSGACRCTKRVRDSRIRGVTEICDPLANASFQIKFDTD